MEMFEDLRNFMNNVAFVVSMVTVILFSLLSGLMVDGYIPMINDWNTFAILIYGMGILYFVPWSYRTMVLREPVFKPVFQTE